MEGFKSFGSRRVTIKLASGFTCIVGPNGAGKSNIIDALCFSLGRLSKKTMRAKSLEDLIFAGARGKNPANRASVTLYFDNSEGLFPGGADSNFTITRTIKRGGGGGYKMAGKKSTRQQILNALAAANIDPDGSNQFILQGKIVELTHMNPDNRRVFIEELIGLQKYDQMKDATMKELEKAERDLGQFEAIFKEVSAQLHKAEKEKNDALAWKELEDKINHYNAQLIALNISKLRAEEDELERKIEKLTKKIEELEEKIQYQENALNQEVHVMENIQRTTLEKEKERETISEKITQLKTELSSSQTTLNLAKKAIEKLNIDKANLETFQMKLEGEQTFDSLIDLISKEIKEIENQIEMAKKEIEKRQQNQAELESKIKTNDDEKATLKAEISSFQQEVSSNNSKIKVLQNNIKKNEEKKKKLETELSKLKGKSESVEDAIEATKKIEAGIRNKINDLKDKISEENQKQKDLENKIRATQEVKNNLNSKLFEIQSSLSSVNTEIKMNKENIENLNNKKITLANKIKELSQGKDTEYVLKELLKEKEKINKKLDELKEKSKEKDSTYRKNEDDIELLKMKRDSFESEITDNKGKINNLNTELKLIKKELTSLEREKRNIDLNLNTLFGNLSKSERELEILNNKKENICRRLEELYKEKETLIKRIENSEGEYEKNAENITSILSILSMLTQNIDISVDSIKSNIQQSNSEAIEHSGEEFRMFVLDIIEIMKIIEAEAEAEAESSAEAESKAEAEMFNSILQTLGLFTDNAEATIDQLMNKAQESSDIAVQESTSEFDSFVQDLMEILENVHLSLRKLTLSKSQELYQQLEEISQNIKSQENDLNSIEKRLTEINVQRKHDSEDFSSSTRKIEDINKRLEEIYDKIEKSERETKGKETIIKEKQEEINELDIEINKRKEVKDDYWEISSKIQDDIDNTQKELEKYQEKLQELQGIQTLFENVVEIDKNIEDLNKAIGEKKRIIVNAEKSIRKVKSEQETLQNDINNLSIEKEKFWEITGALQEQIENENKNLEETMDRLRAFDNVLRITKSIEELAKENIDANKTIQESNNNIGEFKGQVEEIQKKVDETQEVIDSLREDKKKELEAQKVAQTNLNKSNKELQKAQGKLNELNKNKEREQQIFSLGEDIKETEKQVESITTEIEKVQENLESQTGKKDAKQSKIDALVKKKDESWNKQKEGQKIVADLKTDLSMDNSKMNNFELKKIICSDQIETLYQRSKDYGTLPPVTDDLSEEGVQSDIDVAAKKKKALEPVNLKAIQEYDIVKERFDEIDMRRQTIQRERKAILDAIDKIELEKTRSFMKAYHEINREFSRIFQKLSPGGSAKMILERPDKPFDGGVIIAARPRGKRINSLEILSGGEKTLVALSFIFAVQEFYPAPFFVLDEIDASLDVKNCARVSLVIKECSKHAQFLVISHREENIVNADRIYGVTMQQSGITDIFSVDLEGEAKRLLDLKDAKIEQN